MLIPVRSFLAVSISLVTALTVAADNDEVAFEANAHWARYTIDNSSRGADGVRLHDVDGAPWAADIATGWEEGGVIRS